MDNRKDIQEPHDKPASGLRHCQGSDTSCPGSQWAPPHDEIHGTQAPVGGIRTPSSATQMTPHAEWHPAFRTSVELDLEADADKLMFYPERVLNSQSLIIDMLIIRRVPGAVLTTDIAAIFRDFNIMEYKPSGLNIRGFLQGMGYACQSVTYGVMDVPDVSRSQDWTGYGQASDESKPNGVDSKAMTIPGTVESEPLSSTDKADSGSGQVIRESSWNTSTIQDTLSQCPFLGYTTWRASSSPYRSSCRGSWIPGPLCGCQACERISPRSS